MDILLIEDEPELCELLCGHLEQLGHSVQFSHDGAQGLHLALSNAFDLILLDINLPTIDGIEICKAIRQENQSLPILMLTANDQELQIVTGLRSGADDYVTKPFKLSELTARIDALIRRAKSSAPDIRDTPITIGPFRIDSKSIQIWQNDELVPTTKLEFDLLLLLASSPGKSFSRDELLRKIWGVSASGYQNAVNATVLRLRKKIETDSNKPRFICTVRGHGYRFASREELESYSKTK